ncbi:MAG: hypothetical protein CBB88_00655 [Rhizobiales bacterium TMED28]|nr:hypothetical protein [Rhodobiaceae bacterium]OUT83318.1 MAG: hypothetical protein CBB88_00655 [Rhizobiales bacterium TMED28]|tara:strand:- start:1331 stop:1804 length:474 start_codon:yes stop_codon:yes gene_type:complete
MKIEKNEVKKFLSSWTKGVIEIGRAHQEKSDFEGVAINFLNHHYAFEEDDVMFKPTFTSIKLFRNNFEEALSYFIAGSFDEDNGFALKPWAKIELEQEPSIRLVDDCAYAMGSLNFYPLKSEDYSKVVFTFILKKFSNNLKLILHHSSPVPISKLQM